MQIDIELILTIHFNYNTYIILLYQEEITCKVISPVVFNISSFLTVCAITVCIKTCILAGGKANVRAGILSKRILKLEYYKRSIVILWGWTIDI